MRPRSRTSCSTDSIVAQVARTHNNHGIVWLGCNPCTRYYSAQRLLFTHHVFYAHTTHCGIGSYVKCVQKRQYKRLHCYMIVSCIYEWKQQRFWVVLSGLLLTHSVAPAETGYPDQPTFPFPLASLLSCWLSSDQKVHDRRSAAQPQPEPVQQTYTVVLFQTSRHESVPWFCSFTSLHHLSINPFAPSCYYVTRLCPASNRGI